MRRGVDNKAVVPQAGCIAESHQQNLKIYRFLGPNSRPAASESLAFWLLRICILNKFIGLLLYTHLVFTRHWCLETMRLLISDLQGTRQFDCCITLILAVLPHLTNSYIDGMNGS